MLSERIDLCWQLLEILTWAGDRLNHFDQQKFVNITKDTSRILQPPTFDQISKRWSFRGGERTWYQSNIGSRHSCTLTLSCNDICIDDGASPFSQRRGNSGFTTGYTSGQPVEMHCSWKFRTPPYTVYLCKLSGSWGCCEAAFARCWEQTSSCISLPWS